MEQSYEKVGWDLMRNRCSPRRFPTFADLIDVLPQVISSSLYSSDAKSDYAGALATRVQSMTNGITGQIFCGKHELAYKDLLESDVIIDLSRASSTETKSLMMGIIVMKLQEYRMHLDRMNEKQITELAKLSKGVAAIYQSDWIEPVLCQIDRFPDSKMSPLKYTPRLNLMKLDRSGPAVFGCIAS